MGNTTSQIAETREAIKDCKKRIKLLKSARERRRAFAKIQYMFNDSQNELAKAISGLFVGEEGSSPDHDFLVEALKNVGDGFIEAYESGQHVTTMLETDVAEINQPSTFLRSISNVSTTIASVPRSSSARVAPVANKKSKSSMESTLEKLKIREGYLCNYLKIQVEETKKNGDEETNSKLSEAKKDAQSKSKEIKELTDVLLPILHELLKGMIENWKQMSIIYEKQHDIMSQEDFDKCPLFHEDLNLIQLATKLQKWRQFFASYISTQNAYIEALIGYCLEVKEPYNHLQVKEVIEKMNELENRTEKLIEQQRKEHKQMDKIDRLKKTLEFTEYDLELLQKQEDKLKINMKKTDVAIKSFREGFSDVFKSLKEFSEGAKKIYKVSLCATKENCRPHSSATPNSIEYG